MNGFKYHWTCPICGEHVSSYTDEAQNIKMTVHINFHKEGWRERITMYDMKLLGGICISLASDNRTDEELKARYRPAPLRELPDIIDPTQPGPAQAGF